jgi:hypothetical protein
MVKQIKLIMAVVIGAFLIISLQTVSFATSDTYTGYLSDVLCAKNGKSPDGFNLLKSPEKHTVGCMLMRSCVKSGYGIFIKDGAGQYSFFKFDSKGTKLAKGLLDQTDREDNMGVKVTGQLVGDTLMVTNLIEI